VDIAGIALAIPIYRPAFLMLQEISPVTKYINLIMWILPGWWLAEADGQVDEPYVEPEWRSIELREAGFSGCDAIIYDDEQPFQLNTNTISRPLIADSRVNKRVTLLHDSTTESLMVSNLERILID
jgi:hypothetical protein